MSALLPAFQLTLHEQPGDRFRLMFQCHAIDIDHAEEQARNAYPGCELLHAMTIPEDAYIS